MSTKLDRGYQRDLLTWMATAYPNRANVSDFLAGTADEQSNKYAANIQYLEEHGLAEGNLRIGLDGHIMISNPLIYAKGLDFLTDDGGLSAILGVVTIRFGIQRMNDRS